MQHIKKSLLFICFLSGNAGLWAQVNLDLPRNYQYAYDVAHTRSLTGEPGKNYWQNTASYTIQVTSDPVSLLLSGTETIIYTNNSPDTLRNTQFKLYPN